MIVAFTGLAGSGKDTSSDYLVENHGFTKVAFADEMKRTCARIYSKMTREHLWGPSEKRNEPIKDYQREHGPWVVDVNGRAGKFSMCACCNVEYRVGNGTQCYLTARFALQRLGTEWARVCYENTWTDYTFDVATKLLRMSGILRSVHYSYTPWDGLLVSNVPEGPRVKGIVISDLRWPAGNEGKAIRDRGGKLLKLKRGEGLGAASGAHLSETAMAGISDEFFDHVIDNREFSIPQLYAHLSQLASDSLSRRKKTT